METIHVVAALIVDHFRLFTTKRGYGDFKDGWEFPGGKVEEKETPEEALIREIQEELRIKVEITSYFKTIEYDYPTFHLSMRCYWCKIVEGDPVLLEATDSKWLPIEQIDSVDWLPADATIIEDIRDKLIKQTQCGIPTRTQTLEICKVLTDHGYDVGPGIEDEDGDQLEYEIFGIFEEIGMSSYDCSLYFSNENYNVYSHDYQRITYLEFLNKTREAVLSKKEKIDSYNSNSN
ncbi:MAG: (deoxy)nucleoside triphosphate pyrophosphohydrolase [Solobacterium sp.]|nr:(deoxy)nucleoside triphosphate pyrophosphohydrolase [Solobacterium sp.]